MPAINKTKGSADRIKMKIRKGDTVQVISGKDKGKTGEVLKTCLLYTSPSPRDLSTSRMPSSA